MSFSTTLKNMAIVAAMILPAVQASPAGNHWSITKRDPPPKLPGCSTPGDSKWQPAMDFDTDSCYNTPAIGVDGVLNPGLNNCYTTGPAGCRDESDLDNNNVYVRARCNNGWCAHIYGYYFEKDVNLEHVCGVGAGHRNDWEHVVVWVQNDVAKYVAASAHGKYSVRSVESVRWDGDTHPKIIYHREGVQTHSFRFGESPDDAVENHKGAWFYGDLVSYLGFPSTQLRDTMLDNNWGSGAIDFKDSRIAESLNKAKGDFDIPLDTTYDDPIAPGVPDCA